jgi:peptide-methionine (S)-S-oxide reductase
MEDEMTASEPRCAAWAGLALLLAAAAPGPSAAQEGIAIPAPAEAGSPNDAGTEVAVLAGGCFWGVQGVFQHVEGVRNAVSGYAGGAAHTARYRTVGSGRTGHAEAVAVSFDPGVISYGEILRIFFSAAHDPTQLDRQGPDFGPQYRSAIFPRDPGQARIARAYVAQLDATGLYHAPVVTTIEPGRAFYPAEDYHQDYLTLNPTQPYIVHNDLPKLERLKRLFPEVWRDDPALVSEAARSGA